MRETHNTNVGREEDEAFSSDFVPTPHLKQLPLDPGSSLRAHLKSLLPRHRTGLPVSSVYQSSVWPSRPSPCIVTFFPFFPSFCFSLMRQDVWGQRAQSVPCKMPLERLINFKEPDLPPGVGEQIEPCERGGKHSGGFQSLCRAKSYPARVGTQDPLCRGCRTGR